MKQELNRTINILQSLTTKLVDINRKAGTLLTNQQFNNLNARIEQLSALITNKEVIPDQPGQVESSGVYKITGGHMTDIDYPDQLIQLGGIEWIKGNYSFYDTFESPYCIVNRYVNKNECCIYEAISKDTQFISYYELYYSLESQEIMFEKIFDQQQITIDNIDFPIRMNSCVGNQDYLTLDKI